MGKIEIKRCEIEGLAVITPQVYGDERGYFMETYNARDLAQAGIDLTFVQDNQSSSKKGVLRGLHFQIDHPQDKLVRVLVLSDTAEFAYKCTEFYCPDDEGGIAWDDPTIGIEWPIPEGMQLTLSEKDQKWGAFADFTPFER